MLSALRWPPIGRKSGPRIMPTHQISASTKPDRTNLVRAPRLPLTRSRRTKLAQI